VGPTRPSAHAKVTLAVVSARAMSLLRVDKGAVKEQPSSRPVEPAAKYKAPPAPYLVTWFPENVELVMVKVPLTYTAPPPTVP
jgi:hypothetical protein